MRSTYRITKISPRAQWFVKVSLCHKRMPLQKLPCIEAKTAESTHTSVSDEAASGTGPFAFSVQNEVLSSHLDKLPPPAPARLSFNQTNYWHADFLTEQPTSSAFLKTACFAPRLMALSDVCTHMRAHTNTGVP